MNAAIAQKLEGLLESTAPGTAERVTAVNAWLTEAWPTLRTWARVPKLRNVDAEEALMDGSEALIRLLREADPAKVRSPMGLARVAFTTAATAAAARQSISPALARKHARLRKLHATEVQRLGRSVTARELHAAVEREVLAGAAPGRERAKVLGKAGFTVADAAHVIEAVAA